MQLNEMSGELSFNIPVPAMADATTDREDVGIIAPFNMTITGVKWVPKAAVTAHAANYTVLSLRNRGAAGAGTALPASRSYAATNSAAWTAEAMTLSGTAADLSLTAGDVLTVQTVHASSGVIVPAGTLVVSAKIR